MNKTAQLRVVMYATGKGFIDTTFRHDILLVLFQVYYAKVVGGTSSWGFLVVMFLIGC